MEISVFGISVVLVVFIVINKDMVEFYYELVVFDVDFV